MTAYSSLENLLSIVPEKELINLTNDTVPASAVNTEQINSAIEYAAELINSYLRNKYELPLKYIPAIIEKISTDISVYRLYQRRPRKLPEHITDNYKESIRLLTALKKEEMILDLAAEHDGEDITPPAQMVVTNKTKSSRLFGDEMFKGFQL